MELWETRKENLVLWKKPLTTLDYFLRESLYLSSQCFRWLRGHLRSSLTCLSVVLVFIVSYHMDGFHQRYLLAVEKKVLWSLYWIGLGIVSSVGLGTGLHTFILYLGPHIAKVTLAAYECGSLRFPEPPYPDEIVCPDIPDVKTVTLWDIMSKVRLEAFMWGAGTALGELPPYFMAKVKRLSGATLEEVEARELLDSKRNGSIKNSRSKKNNTTTSNNNNNANLLASLVNSFTELFNRASSWMQFLVKKVGFIGILLCASFPNPFYDLAGITCGHFLVPFWTFFGATLIGKAIIKMHLQKLFVIIAFNENLLENFIDRIKDLPVLGNYIHKPLRDILINQKERLHGKVVTKPHWIAAFFEKLVQAMIIYFIVSIINSLAQKYHSRTNNTNHSSSSSTSSSSTGRQDSLTNKRKKKKKAKD